MIIIFEILGVQAWIRAESIKHKTADFTEFILTDGRAYKIKNSDIISIETGV